MIKYRKYIPGLLIVLLLISGLFSFSAAQGKRAAGDLEVTEKNGVLRAGKGWLQEIEGLKIAYYSGSSREIGRQHGLLLIDDPEKMKEVLFSLDPSHQAEGVLEKTGWVFKNLYARFKFYPDFKRHTGEEYLEEMKGFVEGASRGEESDIYNVMMGTASQDISLAGPACSATAVWGKATKDGAMYIGRNLDHKALIDLAEYQHIAFYNPDSGQQFVVHNYPSFVGTMSGMNESGIMISSNYSLAVKEEMTINGLPYMLMLREVLQYASDLDEAINIIKKTPRTIGLNLMLASAEEEQAVVVELTANHLKVRESSQFNIFTTNMFQSEKMKEYQAPGWLSSALRDKRFAELNEEFSGEIDKKNKYLFQKLYLI
jgi:predicted choloylglycine hydrolase